MSSVFDLEGVRRRRKKRRVCNRWPSQAAGQIVPSIPKSSLAAGAGGLILGTSCAMCLM